MQILISLLVVMLVGMILCQCFTFSCYLSFVATHTITLHLDMTQLDLMESTPCCTHSDLMKYRRLGLEVEEIVEVAMKLSSLRNLGLNIKIEG